MTIDVASRLHQTAADLESSPPEAHNDRFDQLMQAHDALLVLFNELADTITALRRDVTEVTEPVTVRHVP